MPSPLSPCHQLASRCQKRVTAGDGKVTGDDSNVTRQRDAMIHAIQSTVYTREVGGSVGESGREGNGPIDPTEARL